MNINKLRISSLIIIFIATQLFTTQILANDFYITQKKNPPAAGEKVIEDPDIPPIFTGGTQQMNKFISSNLRYPSDAASRNAQGLVVYTFIVEKDGTLSNFELMHRADSLLNEEALRILQMMPPWRPAKYKNEVVRSKTYVPMYFRLNKRAKTSNNNRAVAATPSPAVKSENPYAAQQANRYQPTENFEKMAETATERTDAEVFTIVNKMPQFFNGERGLAEFIGNQMRYPIEAKQQGIEGRILCSFIVGIDGRVSNIEIVQGIHPLLDAEAVRVLSLMPKWIPGENNGEKVSVKCLQPIDFRIDEEIIPPLEKE